MNTGIQRSGATPFGAVTTTTPAGKVTSGKKQQRKNLTRIMVGHQIGYVAQASIHNPVDLSKKLKKGIELDGPAFLNILSPCIPGWRIPPDMAVAAARGGVDTCFWPLYEVEDGAYKINYKPKEKLPIEEWLVTQGRFRHLKHPSARPQIEELQRQVDDEWEWLCKQAQ
jgi:pyruvate ferredoxin oxidoreductase beta subunit